MTRNQSYSDYWRSLRRKRLTASNTVAIAIIRATSKRSKKIKDYFTVGLKVTKTQLMAQNKMKWQDRSYLPTTEQAS